MNKYLKYDQTKEKGEFLADIGLRLVSYLAYLQIASLKIIVQIVSVFTFRIYKSNWFMFFKTTQTYT